MWEIGVHSYATVGELGAKTAYSLYKQAGFTVIDWNINTSEDQTAMNEGRYDEAHCIFDKTPEEAMAYWAEELAIMRENGLTVGQAHAPYPSHPLAAANDAALERMISIQKNCIRFCHLAGIPKLVIHGASTSLLTPEEQERMNRHLFAELVPAAREGDTIVCLETLFKGLDFQPSHMCDPDEAIDYVDWLNGMAGKEVFGVCVDVGHLNLVGRDIPSYIRKVGGRIKALHLHDNDRSFDQHKAPYTGTIPWKATMEALRDAGYAGTLSFETFKQTWQKNVEPEMILPWLKLIYDCGLYFRSILEGKN